MLRKSQFPLWKCIQYRQQWRRKHIRYRENSETRLNTLNYVNIHVWLGCNSATITFTLKVTHCTEHCALSIMCQQMHAACSMHDTRSTWSCRSQKWIDMLRTYDYHSFRLQGASTVSFFLSQIAETIVYIRTAFNHRVISLQLLCVALVNTFIVHCRTHAFVHFTMNTLFPLIFRIEVRRCLVRMREQRTHLKISFSIGMLLILFVLFVLLLLHLNICIVPPSHHRQLTASSARVTMQRISVSAAHKFRTSTRHIGTHFEHSSAPLLPMPMWNYIQHSSTQSWRMEHHGSAAAFFSDGYIFKPWSWGNDFAQHPQTSNGANG